MGDTSIPPQEELRRRFRAARALAGLTFEELAERIPPESNLGVRTLRKLEYGEGVLRPPVLVALARAMDFPEAWFFVADVREAFMEKEAIARKRREDEFNARLAALEAQIRELGGPALDADAEPAPRSSGAPRGRGTRSRAQ